MSRFPRLLLSILGITALWFLNPIATARTASAAARGSEVPQGKVDLNTADVGALETLPGVGPATAAAILAARPFTTVDELQDVSGIGPVKMRQLRNRVTVTSGTHGRRLSASATPSRPANDRLSRPAAEKVDINTADAATLEAIPGIGATTARAIVAHRPYASVDELDRVPGIGEAKLGTLRERMTVAPVSHARVAAASHARATHATAGHEPRADSSAAAITPTGRDQHRFANPAAPSTGLVDLNSASEAELESLPEIGPVKARAIIAARPFSRPEDVMRVKGIKQATYEAIQDRIVVR